MGNRRRWSAGGCKCLPSFLSTPALGSPSSCWLTPALVHPLCSFEHSLGVARLGYKQAMHLWNLQRSELGMDKSDVLVVELAGGWGRGLLGPDIRRVYGVGNGQER